MTNLKPLKEKIKAVPAVPGCYLFKSIDDKILYVGKAKNLKSRIGSYFVKSIGKDPKTLTLISKINDIVYIKAETEFEAIILEAELIKKHHPKYNIQLKDNKSYIYLVMRKENKFPQRVLVKRRTDIKKGDIAYGPFPNGNTAKAVLRALRKLFPFRDCSMLKYVRHQKLGRMCLYGDLGLCTGVCIGSGLKVYKKNITELKRILSGKSKTFLRKLEKQMKVYSKDQEYEEAQRVRDKLNRFYYVSRSYRPIQQYIDNPNLVDDLAETAIKMIRDHLPVLNKIPERIECFDVSNISGKEAAGSMVVASGGHLDKGEYKKFKIKSRTTPDDSGMMAEVLKRRLTREVKNKHSWGKPDLLVLDGGKGQIRAVGKVMNKLNYHIPIIGLIKKSEKIVYEKDGYFNEIKLPKSDQGLKLLISLRDEAHRFAQQYHHLLRTRTLRYN